MPKRSSDTIIIDEQPAEASVEAAVVQPSDPQLERRIEALEAINRELLAILREAASQSDPSFKLSLEKWARSK